MRVSLSKILITSILSGCQLLATPIVVVKTQRGYVLGTNGAIVIDGKVIRQACKPLLIGNFALLWAGTKTFGSTDKDGKYTVEVDLGKHLSKVLARGGSLQQVENEVLRVTAEDSRLFRKIHKGPIPISMFRNDFVLAALSSTGAQVAAFSSEIIQPVQQNWLSWKFQTSRPHWDEVLLWHGTQAENPRWSVSGSEKTQTAGRQIALNGLHQITDEYDAEKKVGMDPPYILIDITPEKIQMVDPDKLCSK